MPPLLAFQRPALALACALIMSLPVTDSAQAAPTALPTPTLTLNLWEGPAPGLIGDPGPEEMVGKGRVANVSVPTLDVYLPEPGRGNGVGIIICSGGGYKRIASGVRGAGAAALFVPQGYTVFSLKYRLTPPSKDIMADTLADAERAMRLVRNRQEEWGLRSVGIQGASAGANLVLNLCCNYDAGDPASPDPLEKHSSRPDFAILTCPWPGGKKIDYFQLRPDAPPAFIVHARDDKTAPFTFGESVYAAWKAAGIPAEFIPYETGGHEAFSFGEPMSAKDWPDKMVAWLKETVPHGGG